MLTAALALVALPGLGASHATSVMAPLPADAFQPIHVPASVPGAPSVVQSELHLRAASEGLVDADAPFVEPGEAIATGPDRRVRVNQPAAAPTSERKPPKYTLRGEATFYDAGYTAMRLPRGTVVVICGDGGCIERTITDYGPVRPSRIVDLYRPDFFAICGCPSWSGVVDVTVYVY